MQCVVVSYQLSVVGGMAVSDQPSAVGSPGPLGAGVLGFTHILVVSGFWILKSHLLRAVFSKFPFYPTYALSRTHFRVTFSNPCLP